VQNCLKTQPKNFFPTVRWSREGLR
jgi:hypothetical protein